MDIKSFFEQYKFYLIGACAVLAVIVYFAVTSDDAQTDSLSFDTIQSETPEADAAEDHDRRCGGVFVVWQPDRPRDGAGA